MDGVSTVLFGLPLTADQARVAEQCTSRVEFSSTQFVEAWLCCGRRSGKSFLLALIAVYLGCFRSYAQYHGSNEKATLAIIATDGVRPVSSTGLCVASWKAA